MQLAELCWSQERCCARDVYTHYIYSDLQGDLQGQPISPPVPLTSAPSPFLRSQTTLSPHCHTRPVAAGPNSSPLCVSRPFFPLKLSSHLSTPTPSPLSHSSHAAALVCPFAGAQAGAFPGMLSARQFPHRLYRWHHR